MNPFKSWETTLLHRTVRAPLSSGVTETFANAVWTTEIKHIVCILITNKNKNRQLHFKVLVPNQSCTFRKEYVNFSRVGFPSCIYSIQIQLCCFSGKLKSTVIPACGAQLCSFTWLLLRWHDVRYILAVGTEPFGGLTGRKRKSWGTFSRLTIEFLSANMWYHESPQTCLVCVPSKTSGCWLVLSRDPLKTSSTTQSIQKELK